MSVTPSMHVIETLFNEQGVHKQERREHLRQEMIESFSDNGSHRRAKK